MTDRTSSRMGQRGRRLCFGFAGLAGLLAACGSPDGGDLFSNSGSDQAKPTGGDTGTAGSATAAGGSEVDGGEPGSGGSVSTGAVPANGGSAQGEAGTTIDSGGDTSTDAGAADGGKAAGGSSGSGASGGTSTGGTSAGDGNAGADSAGSGNTGATSTGGSSGGDAGQSNGGGTSGQAGEPGAAGQPAEEDCDAVWREVQAALAEAQACSQRDGQSCAGFVEGMCCPVPVNDPNSAETKHYLELLAHAQDACPNIFCPAVPCPENPRARCELSNGESRCASSWWDGGVLD